MDAFNFYLLYMYIRKLVLCILIEFSNVIRTQLKYGVDDLLVTNSKSFLKRNYMIEKEWFCQREKFNFDNGI